MRIKEELKALDALQPVAHRRPQPGMLPVTNLPRQRVELAVPISWHTHDLPQQAGALFRQPRVLELYTLQGVHLIVITATKEKAAHTHTTQNRVLMAPVSHCRARLRAAQPHFAARLATHARLTPLHKSAHSVSRPAHLPPCLPEARPRRSLSFRAGDSDRPDLGRCASSRSRMRSCDACIRLPCSII